MELELYWTHFAEKELENIYLYYREHTSIRIAKKLINGIYNETFKLKEHPNIGQLEPLLEDRSENFKYLTFKNYKIIYWINYEKNRIEINDVFDTRQNPIKMKRS